MKIDINLDPRKLVFAQARAVRSILDKKYGAEQVTVTVDPSDTGTTGVTVHEPQTNKIRRANYRRQLNLPPPVKGTTGDADLTGPQRRRIKHKRGHHQAAARR